MSLPYEEDFFMLDKLMADLHKALHLNVKYRDPARFFAQSIGFNKPSEFEKAFDFFFENFPSSPQFFKDSQGNECFLISFYPGEEPRVARAISQLSSYNTAFKIEKYIVRHKPSSFPMLRLRNRVWVVRNVSLSQDDE